MTKISNTTSLKTRLSQSFYSIFPLATLICVCFIHDAAAQADGKGQTTDAPPKNIVYKIAVFDTALFSNSQTGVKRLSQALKDLEAETRELAIEIDSLQQQLNQISQQSNEAESDDAREREQKNARVSQIREEIQQKQTRRGLNRADAAQTARVASINAEIRRALISFVKEKGFNLLLDKSQNQNSIVWAADAIDITKEFIEYYNSRFAVKTDNKP